MHEPRTPPSLAYAAVLADLTTMRALVRQLEVDALRLMKDAGVTDEAIGDELGISSQAVGKKRHA